MRLRIERALRAVTVLALVAAAAPETLAAQQKVSRRWPANSDAMVRVHNQNGNVRVVGWDRDSVVVYAAIEPGAGELFGGGNPPAIKLGVWNEREDAQSARAFLEVRVPHGAQVWVKTEGAPIEVVGVTGSLDLTSVTGGIKVSGSTRDVVAESMGGDVRIEANGRTLRARTGSGTLDVSGVSSDATLTTVSGAINALGARFERARIESVTGNVAFDAIVEKGNVIELQTHSGAISIRLPLASSVDFALRTIKGNIENSLSAQRAKPKSGALNFALGDAGASIDARSFSGAIVLRKK
jgi:hypothetical protein